jgi:hypothetical protein
MVEIKQRSRIDVGLIGFGGSQLNTVAKGDRIVGVTPLFVLSFEKHT